MTRLAHPFRSFSCRCGGRRRRFGRVARQQQRRSAPPQSTSLAASSPVSERSTPTSSVQNSPSSYFFAPCLLLLHPFVSTAHPARRRSSRGQRSSWSGPVYCQKPCCAARARVLSPPFSPRPRPRRRRPTAARTVLGTAPASVPLLATRRNASRCRRKNSSPVLSIFLSTLLLELRIFCRCCSSRLFSASQSARNSPSLRRHPGCARPSVIPPLLVVLHVPTAVVVRLAHPSSSAAHTPSPGFRYGDAVPRDSRV